MAKMALCIRRNDLEELNRVLRYNKMKGMMIANAPAEFLRLETKLQDRAQCETDPSWLQLLPYVVIRRADTGQIFTYCRGKGGAEARLHGNLSIGVGGHVDTDVERSPEDSLKESMDLMVHLEDSAMRELEEEVGFVVEKDDDGECLHMPFMWNDDLIYDDTNDVGRVHLGMLIVMNVPDNSVLGSTEVGVIEGSQWLYLDDLQEPAVYDRLENWSKIVVTYMSKNT